MFPIKDDNPTSTFPLVTLSIIFVNILVFLYQLSLGPALESFIFRMGIVPYEVTHFADIGPV
ncbi:rhomboid family intramembrane serine protease, partial [bacterium]|nr:rhomboid family intramembrane serine protease [bacterium]